MTTFNEFSDRNRDQQDGFERGVWGEQTFVDGAGSIMRVRGTGTEDEEAVVINQGMGMHVPKDTNTEVFLIANASDTNQKHAMLSIPRDKQRQWKESTNGIQAWNDPARAIEFNATRTYLDDANFATRGGVLEVKGSDVYVRGNLYVDGNVGATQKFQSPNPPETPPPTAPGTVTVPGFAE